MHFFIVYFLSEISKFAAETSHIVSGSLFFLLKRDKFGSNFVLIKQNLPNSIILPPGFKARSHSVRKANSILPEFKENCTLKYVILSRRLINDVK